MKIIQKSTSNYRTTRKALFLGLLVAYLIIIVFLQSRVHEGTYVSLGFENKDVDGKRRALESSVLWRSLNRSIGIPNQSTTTSKQREIKTHSTVWPRPYEPSPRPPLKDIVQGWNVTSDPQWLLNFAIAGFPKSGTSSLMHFFRQHAPEVQIFPKEECSMSGNQYAPLIERLYNEFSPGDYVRGLKCPRELESNNVALPNYAKYFPKTDFIVGVRHPVLWFESFYNHRIHNGNKLQPPNQLLKACRKGSRGVCGDRARYHWWLVWLHKTPMNTTQEQAFFPKYQRRKNFDVGWNGRVFLYDVAQLRAGGEGVTDTSLSKEFRTDLQRFLYLQQELPAIPWFRPGNKNYTKEEMLVVNERKIDICHTNYTDVREALIGIGKEASTWILRYFLVSPDVIVSSPQQFRQHVLAWQRDPCTDPIQAMARNVSQHVQCTQNGCYVPSQATQPKW